jgi:hypothetical protein
VGAATIRVIVGAATRLRLRLSAARVDSDQTAIRFLKIKYRFKINGLVDALEIRNKKKPRENEANFRSPQGEADRSFGTGLNNAIDYQ